MSLVTCLVGCFFKADIFNLILFLFLFFNVKCLQKAPKRASDWNEKDGRPKQTFSLTRDKQNR